MSLTICGGNLDIELQHNNEIQTAEKLLRKKKYVQLFVQPVSPLSFDLSFVNFAQTIRTNISTYSANLIYAACKLLKLEAPDKRQK